MAGVRCIAGVSDWPMAGATGGGGRVRLPGWTCRRGCIVWGLRPPEILACGLSTDDLLELQLRHDHVGKRPDVFLDNQSEFGPGTAAGVIGHGPDPPAHAGVRQHAAQFSLEPRKCDLPVRFLVRRGQLVNT